MDKTKYYNAEDLNKFCLQKNQWGQTCEVGEVEKFYVRQFNIRGNKCDYCGYCYNSIPAFCRVQKNVEHLVHHSWLRTLNPCSGILKKDNKETVYNLTCTRPAWGVCAFFIYTKRIDDKGRSRYTWADDKEYILDECRKIYFRICYEIYKTQNIDDYRWHETNKEIRAFMSQFAEYHINYERALIERTVNTHDLFEEYDKSLGIKQEAEEYLKWVRSTYILSLTETTQTIERDPYLLCLFNKNEAVYDKFFERCAGKAKINIVTELTAATIAITGENKYLAHLLERGKDFVTLHNELSKHFELAGYSSFAKAITEYSAIPKERQYKINTAKEEYSKLLP